MSKPSTCELETPLPLLLRLLSLQNRGTDGLVSDQLADQLNFNKRNAWRRDEDAVGKLKSCFPDTYLHSGTSLLEFSKGCFSPQSCHLYYLFIYMVLIMFGVCQLFEEWYFSYFCWLLSSVQLLKLTFSVSKQSSSFSLYGFQKGVWLT